MVHRYVTLAALVWVLTAPVRARQTSPDTAVGPVVFVDASASGAATGTSWVDAFPTIHDAFAYADLYGDLVREVWVAEGTYRPTNDDPNSDDPREAAFRLRSGLSLFGGFAGTETSIDERDWVAYPTVLSGDLGVVGDPSDNAYSVVRAHLVDSTTVLDGFVITGGNANDEALNGIGGGFHITSSDLVLRNLRVIGNAAASDGGGGYIDGGAPRMNGLVFEANTAGTYGGGLYVNAGYYGGGVTILTDAAFVGNTAHHGGGLYWKAEVGETGGVIERVAFEANAADLESGRGGGMSTGNSYGSILASDLTFAGNTAFMGGGFGDYGSSGLVMSRATFTGNEAIYGGGFATGGTEGRPTLRDARFEANVAQEAGGGFYCGEVPGSSWSGGALIVGAEFVRNTATEGGGLACRGSFTYNLVYNASFLGNIAERGGAISMFQGTESLFVNAVIAGNAATEGGVLYGAAPVRFAQVTAVGNAGGVRLPTGGSFIAENSILWGNGPAILHEGYVRIWVWDNIIEGGCPSPPGDIACSGVRSLDPLMAGTPAPGPDGVWGTEDDDYGELRLQPGSPAVNSGSNGRLPLDFGDLDGDGDIMEPIPYDRAGDARVQDGNPDLGAFEGGYLVTAEPSATTGAVDELAPAYPNPASSSANFSLTLATARSQVTVEAYDLLGRRVAVLHEGLLPAGEHAFTLNGSSLPGGVYVVRVAGNGLNLTQRVTLVR